MGVPAARGPIDRQRREPKNLEPLSHLVGDIDRDLEAIVAMAVEPNQQRTGIGSALVEAGIEACRADDVDAIFVLGHRGYYPRFGFTSAPARGLRFRGPQFDSSFFVLELRGGALDGLDGLVAYVPEFDDL